VARCKAFLVVALFIVKHLRANRSNRKNRLKEYVGISSPVK
jgi:hypothetical protein